MKAAAIFMTALLVAGPASAWELRKSTESATTSKIVGDVSISITCDRRSRDQVGISISDLTGTGKGFEEVTPLMAWIRLPDGRTAKWSFAGYPEGPAFAGVMPVSSQNLDFFGNAESFSLQNQRSGQTIIQTDMRGTGAARIAFRERCGF